ncbi:MAG: hypothetical protein ACKOPT_04485 [Cyanobium sp.]
MLVLISLTAGAAVIKAMSLIPGLPQRHETHPAMQQQNRLPPGGNGPGDHSNRKQGGGRIAQP